MIDARLRMPRTTARAPSPIRRIGPRLTGWSSPALTGLSMTRPRPGAV